MLRLEIFKCLLRRLHRLGPWCRLRRLEPSSSSPYGGDVEAIKAKIISHPHYYSLFTAYLEYNKVGAPPEVSVRLTEIAQEVETRQHTRARRPGRCDGAGAGPVHGGVPRDASEVRGGADEAAAGGDGVHAKGGVAAQLAFHLRKVAAQHPFIWALAEKRHPHEHLAEVGEDGRLEDGVGREVLKLEAELLQQQQEERRDRQRQPAGEEEMKNTNSSAARSPRGVVPAWILLANTRVLHLSRLRTRLSAPSDWKRSG
jgi:hypothetical protein